MRPIWRVITAITPMRRPYAFNSGTLVKHWKSTIWLCNELWWCLLPFHAQFAAQTMNYYASAAMRRPRVGRNAADYVLILSVLQNLCSCQWNLKRWTILSYNNSWWSDIVLFIDVTSLCPHNLVSLAWNTLHLLNILKRRILIQCFKIISTVLCIYNLLTIEYFVLKVEFINLY